MLKISDSRDALVSRLIDAPLAALLAVFPRVMHVAFAKLVIYYAARGLKIIHEQRGNRMVVKMSFNREESEWRRSAACSMEPASRATGE